MDIRPLKQDFYNQLIIGKPQVLQKNRGYGVVSITINDLIYAIPLRSNLNHTNGFKTISIEIDGQIVWNGLDYSKALIVESDNIGTTSFNTRNQEEFDKIQENKDKIKSEFATYVSNYIKCVEKGTSSTDRRFKFTTLQYFHSELGI
jgi:protein AbiQ